MRKSKDEKNKKNDSLKVKATHAVVVALGDDFEKGLVEDKCWREYGQHNYMISKTNRNLLHSMEGQLFSKKATELVHSLMEKYGTVKEIEEHHKLFGNRSGLLHLEHLIPCKELETHLKSLNNPTLQDVQEAMDYSLKEIVIITAEERELLDQKGSKIINSMPEDWKWGDCKFSRLTQVGIKVIGRN